jgi:hypothetical protein
MVDNWTCRWMSECVAYVISELRRRSLIQSWIEASEIWQGVLAPCKSCASGKSNNKKCRGWRLAFRDHQALVLVPAVIKKRSLQVAIEGQFDVQRGVGPPPFWSRNPMRECNGVLQVTDPLRSELLTRQHLDLANAGQPGTVWHLQLGGVGGGEDKEVLRAISALRWPAAPTDFVLLVELALFLFHWNDWSELRDRLPWRDFVQGAENLVLQHYRDALDSYWDQRGRFPSWLAMQCNLTGEIDPRPT